MQRSEQDLAWEAIEQAGVELEPQRLRGKPGGREVERDEVDLPVVAEPAPLVGEHRLGDEHAAKGQRHAERLAPVEQPLDQGVGFALRLRVPVAVERLEVRPSRLDIEVQDLIRAAEVQIDRALVKRRECACKMCIRDSQTGSGTSTNTNANEVIAALAGGGVHANDHVNLGQSSNDVFPSAVHLAALEQAEHELGPALESLEAALTAKAEAFHGIVKTGRTHLMDAVPVTLGQEFSGYAAQVRLARRRVESALPRVAQIPLGGTATGTGLNTHPEFAARVRARLSAETKLQIEPPEDPFESQGNRDALVELSGALKVLAVSLTKIAQDLALMGSGPRAGIGEIFLPELQKGSSIMPGKVNPVIPEVVLQVAAQAIGNDTAITIGGMQGNLELNVRVPLIARNLLASLELLAHAVKALDEKCVSGIEANLAGCERGAEATLAAATALNPYIGYDAAGEIVKEATRSGRSLREVAREMGVSEKILDEALDLRKMALGG